MSGLEQALVDFAKANDLFTASVGVRILDNGDAFFEITASWLDGGARTGSSAANGIADRLDDAIADLDERVTFQRGKALATRVLQIGDFA